MEKDSSNRPFEKFNKIAINRSVTILGILNKQKDVIMSSRILMWGYNVNYEQF